MTERHERRQARRNFLHLAAGGVLFQGGAAAIDTSTIVAGLVHGLTGSTFAVGAAAAIAHYGWLFPQLFVAHIAQRRTFRMPLYRLGAFGRVGCLVGLAALLWLGGDLPRGLMVTWFFAMWTAYAFVGGIVAAPYNDIVARAVPSERRSRLLAVRFFGGGVLALGVAALAHRALGATDGLPFTFGYAVIFLLGAALLAGSATAFSTAVEPPAPPSRTHSSFRAFLADGLHVLREDQRFRRFLAAQWLGGGATMALPFYILQPIRAGGALGTDVALLLGAQTIGMLVSSPLWGWWGDRRGKLSLLLLAVGLGTLAPALTLAWLALGLQDRGIGLLWFGFVFFLLGAVGNGRIIAQLGYLMEISPDDRRPAYSGYFNMLVAPAALLPMLGAVLAEAFSFAAVFACSLAAAVLQFWTLWRPAESDVGVRT
ncbi:MAG: MFS transporter [Alphaproteobacteria bacterium]